ncbi:MAG: hypothetical protein KDH88_13085 [Chromatiales bacterium]|nr:hypothetical protein [Chromatiales bacterium]
MKSWYGVLAGLVLAGGLSGCSFNNERKDIDLVEASYSAVDSIHDQLNGRVDMSRPVIVTSFVNVDDLTQSSSLGRIIGEQFASRMSQLGYRVIEMKLRDTVFIQEKNGEFMLSRKLRDISAEHQADGIVVGTYAVGKDHAYVTARVVQAVDSTLVAGHDYAIPLGPDAQSMLKQRKHRSSSAAGGGLSAAY